MADKINPISNKPKSAKRPSQPKRTQKTIANPGTPGQY